MSNDKTKEPAITGSSAPEPKIKKKKPLRYPATMGSSLKKLTRLSIERGSI